MRHRVRGRKLGRNASHRKAMFRNMAVSLIRSVSVDEDDPQRPRVPGRVVTTLPKAKELRPFVEKLITLGRKGAALEKAAEQYASGSDRNSADWKKWRESDKWNQWNQAIAPAVACRRRAFAMLRDHEAVQILFDELAGRFEDRPGGYTRVVRLAAVRLGDGGQKAFIEFVGERDRVKSKKRNRPVVEDEVTPSKPADEESPAEEDDAKPEDEASQSDAEASAESDETKEG
ncbi:MAG: bL17 family ribosomal protein [Planctomycetaceae bacterium]